MTIQQDSSSKQMIRSVQGHLGNPAKHFLQVPSHSAFHALPSSEITAPMYGIQQPVNLLDLEYNDEAYESFDEVASVAGCNNTRNLSIKSYRQSYQEQTFRTHNYQTPSQISSRTGDTVTTPPYSSTNAHHGTNLQSTYTTDNNVSRPMEPLPLHSMAHWQSCYNTTTNQYQPNGSSTLQSAFQSVSSIPATQPQILYDTPSLYDTAQNTRYTGDKDTNAYYTSIPSSNDSLEVPSSDDIATTARLYNLSQYSQVRSISDDAQSIIESNATCLSQTNDPSTQSVRSDMVKTKGKSKSSSKHSNTSMAMFTPSTTSYINTAAHPYAQMLMNLSGPGSYSNVYPGNTYSTNTSSYFSSPYPLSISSYTNGASFPSSTSYSTNNSFSNTAVSTANSSYNQSSTNGMSHSISAPSSCSSSTSESRRVRSKAYEAESSTYARRACVACKQSHVACDIKRPCHRCDRLGKGDTCVDAERKKRGRPCGSGKKRVL
ncbi:hypothetical protein F4703DRAFT_1512475 [Phycomyces blakesleeanus]